MPHQWLARLTRKSGSTSRTQVLDGCGTYQDVETIGERVRRLRVECGLSQRDLVQRGVSTAFVSRIEAGARIPSGKALRVLAERLGTTALYLEAGHHDIACPHCGREP